MRHIRRGIILIAMLLAVVGATTLVAGNAALAAPGRMTVPKPMAQPPDVAALLSAAGHSPEAYTAEQAIEVLIAEAERLLAAGRAAAAIPHYHLATAAAQSIDATDDLAFLRQRLGAANWAIYGETDDPQFARVALLYWQIERDMYAAMDYPAVFGATAAYDIGRAHVALAAHDARQARLEAAAQAVRGEDGAVPGHTVPLAAPVRTVGR